MDNARVKADEIDREFGEIFGRHYSCVETYYTDDAETVLIAYSTMAQTVLHTVKQLRAQGRKVGMIRLRMLRPFPTEQLLSAMNPDTRYIVLDRNLSYGAGGIFAQEIRNCVYRHHLRPLIFDVCIGMGGRDVTPAVIAGVVEKYEKQETVDQDFYWEGVRF
jgi:pyruvate/2-oxoacid:ferredoxin oxidoreductase alpha subunit